MRVVRLGSRDGETAAELFALLAGVFETTYVPLSDAYVDRMLGRDDIWVLAAFDGDRIVGGLTAHTLPMTREEASEIFVYDIAVHRDHQRRGVGRALVASLRESAARIGIGVLFVAADNEDTHALDFYRALGGTPAPVTMFTFDEGTGL